MLFRSTDGLRIKDVVDLSIDTKSRRVKFSKVPARVVIRQDLSKAKHAYSTFLSAEACEYLADYLDSRLHPGPDWKKGEKLGPDSAVIAPEWARREFISTTNIGDTVRQAIRAAGLRARPYALRTTFATRLLSAEAEGKVPHSIVQFWMGHRGDMTARYAQNRGQLPPEVIEQMREAYRRCEPYLSTSTAPADSKMEAFVKLLLQANSIDDAAIRKLESEGALTPEKALEVLREAGIGKKASTAPVPPTRIGEQKLVPASEVDGWLGLGWSGKFAVGDRVMLEGAAPPDR